MIGRLLVSAQITQQQAQAARVFSEVYAAYRAEIGVSESKSCLAESSGGFDASDGDPETYKRYYAICEKLGAALSATLKNECGKMDGDKPRSIEALRAALDRLTA
jgi:hypothetical protein